MKAEIKDNVLTITGETGEENYLLGKFADDYVHDKAKFNLVIDMEHGYTRPINVPAGG